MNFELAEQEIVNRLNAQILANNVSNLYEAVVIPETEQEFKAFHANFTKGRIAVEFIDLIPLPSNSVGKVAQEKTVRFRLSFESRKLKGPGGLYALYQIAEICLVGFKLTNAIDRLTLTKYGMLEFAQGGIQPYYEFECKAVHVQTFTDFSDDVPFGTEPIKVTFPPEIL